MNAILVEIGCLNSDENRAIARAVLSQTFGISHCCAGQMLDSQVSEFKEAECSGGRLSITVEQGAKLTENNLRSLSKNRMGIVYNLGDKTDHLISSHTNNFKFSNDGVGFGDRLSVKRLIDGEEVGLYVIVSIVHKELSIIGVKSVPDSDEGPLSEISG